MTTTRRALLLGLALCLSCEPRRPPNTARNVEPLDPALLSALSAPEASTRAHAAWTLGQLGVSWDDIGVELQASADRHLCDRYDAERDPAVREAIVAALGRVGRAHGRSLLLAIVEAGGPSRATAGWALVHLYRRLGSAIDPTPDVDGLGKALQLAPEADVRAAVTAALAETKRPNARSLLVHQLADTDALTRAEAAHGLVELATPDDTPALVRVLADADERVAAAASLALFELAEHGAAPTLAVDVLMHEAASFARPAVVVALEERAFVQERLVPVFAKLEMLLQVEGQARLACLAALAHDRALAHVDHVDKCSGLDELTHTRYAARVLAEADPRRVPVAALLELVTTDSQARSTLLEGLSRYDDAKSAQAIVSAAADNDLQVRSSAGDAAVPRKLAAAGPPLLAGVAAIAEHAATLSVDEAGTLPSLLNAIAVLRPPGGAEVLRSFLEGTPTADALAARAALKAYGEPSLAHPTPPHGRYDADPWPSGPVVVRLETDRGTIRMEVDAAHAPRNARNFVGLVKRGFYDGLTFHRIVPGFVAQGGDPRGDGTGGADSLVACEPNDLPYREGTVGMALAGPDTGSSQFFIALAPAPHLEGRYTAFARVVEGMGVARALEPGDHIKSARVE